MSATHESLTGSAPLSHVIADLRATSQRLQQEIDRLTERLGAAVMDGDQPLIETLEPQLDLLTARLRGISQELTALETAAASTDVREQRRREALERERARRELVAFQLELYSGWRATLEHQACVAELTRELEQLRNASPVDRSRLDQLRDRLAAADIAVDTTALELETSDDPARLREAARHYGELLRAVGGDHPASPAPTEVPRAPATAEVLTQDSPRAEPAAEAPEPQATEPVVESPVSTAASAEADSEPATAAFGPPVPEVLLEQPARTPHEPEAPAPPRTPVAEAPQQPTRASEAAPQTRESEATEQELRRLDAEEQRLRMWRASLERQGDPLGVLQEVDQQLEEVQSKRATILEYQQRVQARNRPRPAAVAASSGRSWWQRLGLGD